MTTIRVRKCFNHLNGRKVPRYRYYKGTHFFTEKELETFKEKEFVFAKTMNEEDKQIVLKKWEGK